MNKILATIITVIVAGSVFADGKLWIKVDSSTVNEVFFSFAQGQEKEQKVDKDWVNEPAGYFVLNGGIVDRKTGDALRIAELPERYRKDGPGGVWVEKTPAEKAAADAEYKKDEATKLAQKAVITSLRELANETFGNASKEITEQELIDRIETKL